MPKELAFSWGSRLALDGKEVASQLPALRTVGLRNLMEVVRHDVVRVAGSTSHTVHFRDGGLAQFAYNDAGELIELSGYRCTVLADRHGRLLIGAYVDPGTPPAPPAPDDPAPA